jgi:hypothetical protein
VHHTEIADERTRFLGNSVKVGYEAIQGEEDMEARTSAERRGKPRFSRPILFLQKPEQ